MLNTVKSGNRLRVDFSKIQLNLDIPHLLQLQKNSYENFLMMNRGDRSESGIEKAFKSIFPIHDQQNRLTLEYAGSEILKPKYTIRECMERGLTYSVSLKIKIRLIIWERDEKSGEKLGVKEVKEQSVFVRDIPLMTDRVSFIINGVERVVVNQLHRSPGVIFKEEESPTSEGKLVYSAQIIPDRGAWIYFEYDPKDVLYVRINKRRKIPVTIFFRALGYNKRDILKLFYPITKIVVKDNKFFTEFVPEEFIGRVSYDVRDEDGNLIIQAAKRLTLKKAKKLYEEGLRLVEFPVEILIDRFLSDPIVDEQSGEIIFDTLAHLDENKLKKILEYNIKEFLYCKRFGKWDR